jgi:hypothetical protein
MPVTWRSPSSFQFDDDDAGALARHRLRPAEAGRQVHHRHHRAAQVDHAADRVRHHRHFGDAAEFDDLLHRHDADAERFAAQHEGEVLLD